DKATFGSLPADALAHAATIGYYHGTTSHDNARKVVMEMGGRSFPLMLAAALPSTASIRCAMLGTTSISGVNTSPPTENGVSMQRILDTQSTIDALGGGMPDPSTPDRAIGALTLSEAVAMSQGRLAASPVSLKSVGEGYGAAIATLQQPAQMLDLT